MHSAKLWIDRTNFRKMKTMIGHSAPLADGVADGVIVVRIGEEH